jgi:cobalt/nickel transport system permease protein
MQAMDSLGLVWAVHILDGALRWPWLGGGFVVAAVLVWFGSRRLTEEEIPRVGVLSAAFFVASSIHVPVGASSVHLLLNGLVGVILGPRSSVAIALGLFLQAALLSHGGITTLGVNCCLMTLPALVAWLAFEHIKQRGWLELGLARWLAGFALGALTVLATTMLACLVLRLGGNPDWTALVTVLFIGHLPVAAVEALVMAATINFLFAVKPEMLGLQRRNGRQNDYKP